MRPLEVFVLAIVIVGTAGSPILQWGKQDGNSLLGKVTNLKQAVYEKKREFINGVNEKVSRMLLIPPWPSTTTTEAIPDSFPVQHDPVSETPSLWWWQSTPQPEEPTTRTEAMTSTTERTSPSTARVRASTTHAPPTPTAQVQLDNDRLVFTMADTNELEVPLVSMYARSGFIPPELRLTDSVEYLGPTYGRGPATPAKHSNQLIVL